jgi:hypothetical protein
MSVVVFGFLVGGVLLARAEPPPGDAARRAHRMAAAAGLPAGDEQRFVPLLEAAERRYQALVREDAAEKRELEQLVTASSADRARISSLVGQILSNESRAAQINLELLQDCRRLMDDTQYARMLTRWSERAPEAHQALGDPR